MPALVTSPASSREHRPEGSKGGRHAQVSVPEHVTHPGSGRHKPGLLGLSQRSRLVPQPPSGAPAFPHFTLHPKLMLLSLSPTQFHTQAWARGHHCPCSLSVQAQGTLGQQLKHFRCPGTRDARGRSEAQCPLRTCQITRLCHARASPQTSSHHRLAQGKWL